MRKLIVILTTICLFTLSIGGTCLASDSLRTTRNQDAPAETENANPKDTFQQASTEPTDPPALQTFSAQKDYVIRKFTDYDTGYTLARSYAPADYEVYNLFFNSLSEDGECSIACPYQVAIAEVSPDSSTNMIYRSEMTYLYPPDPDRYFQEGVRFGTNMDTFIGYPMEMMMYPRTALELADTVAARMFPEGTDITRYALHYVTDEEDPFLESQSQARMDYYNTGSPYDILFNVTCDNVLTTYVDVTYQAETDGQTAFVRMVLSTSIVHLISTDYYTNAVSDMSETIVPYFYCCSTTPEAMEEAFADFDLFVANTRVTDEFWILNRKESLLLNEIISQGWSQYDEEELWSHLGTGDGSYYEDQFSDYILDQNEYTTTDGRTFKVPTSYDYVYETADGEIVVSNSADEPAGSVRLYAK